MVLWWMSFVAPDSPEGEQFVGAALVEADDLPSAITRSWERGCNPGGEIQAVPLPVDEIETERLLALARAPRDTLMDRRTLGAIGLLD